MPGRPNDSLTPDATMATACVVIIGDEVLAGEVVDQNGPLILALLAERGIRVLGLHVLPDESEVVEAYLRDASQRADSVLVTGGIGPTHDDITRLAVARALARPLSPHPDATARLDAIFHRDGTAEERDMALLPEGAELLFASGIMAFAFQVENVFVFPGVPRLLDPLLRANLERLGRR